MLHFVSCVKKISFHWKAFYYGFCGFYLPPESPRNSCSFLSCIYKNSGFHIPLPVLQMRNSSNQIYFTLGFFFSKYDSADVVVVLVWFVFFSDFKRDKFKALQGHQAKHTLRFFKALSQYTMYDIYAQWFGLCLEY